MNKFEKLKNLLGSIYCHNCKYGNYSEEPDDDDAIDPCDECHRKSMYWRPSKDFINQILKSLEDESNN